MPTTSSGPSAAPPALVVLAAACALLTVAVALAGPAAAIEDLRRPTAKVTHGPSCGPAVVRVAVTNGTAAHRVALVFDHSGAQDDAILGNGEKAELVSEDVDWGQTVDVSVTVTGADGTAEAPIEFGTYTRPSAEDCAAVTPTTAKSTMSTPTVSTGTTSASTDSPTPVPGSRWTPNTPGTPPPSWSAPAAADVPQSTPPVASGADGETSGQAGSASSASVSPGGVVTLRATGFSAGEPVTVSILGVDEPLTTVTAAPDGRVEAVVQIPRGAALGTVNVQLVGTVSASTAGLDLHVAARSRLVPEQTNSVPAVAAGIGLIGAAGVLGLLAARRSREYHPLPR